MNNKIATSVTFIVIAILSFSFIANERISDIEDSLKKKMKAPKTHVLVFSKTNTWRHEAIPAGIAMIKKICKRNGWRPYFTEETSYITSEHLKKFSSVVFLNTTGDILGHGEERAFESYLRNGGGFVGIHSAADTEQEWSFYTDMMGAKFRDHPDVQTAKVTAHKETNHPAIQHFDDTFEFRDEWYNFKGSVSKHVNVLLEVDESSYKGEKMNQKHPISWYSIYEGARVFYTGLGHTAEAYMNAGFQKHVEEGLKWANGNTTVKLPSEWQYLLDKDFSNWDTWLGVVHNSVELDGYEKNDDVTSGLPIGLNSDPKNVYQLIDEEGTPVLKISGEIYGGLTSKNEYGNYHFSTQFKWGEQRWAPHLNDKRDSGVLYHCKGSHGAFWKVWKASLGCQIKEEGCGDFISLGNVYGDVPTKIVMEDSKKTFIFGPSQTPLPIKWGHKFETGYVGKSVDQENPFGEWNTLEIMVFGDKSLHIVNGKLVNAVKNIRYDVAGVTKPVTNGQIQIQSEGAEIYYKDMKIKGISGLPAKFKTELGW